MSNKRLLYVGVHCGGRTVQLDFDHPHHSRTFRLCVHGGQRGDIRHLPPEPGRGSAVVLEPEPSGRADRVVRNGLVEVRRFDGTRTRPSSKPTWCRTRAHTLPAGHVRADRVGREGFLRAAVHRRHHQRLFRPRQPNGQVRPQERQVHGALHAVPGRRRAHGRERRDSRDQEQTVRTVRGLVPATGFKVGINCQPPTVVPGGDLAKMSRAPSACCPTPRQSGRLGPV